MRFCLLTVMNKSVNKMGALKWIESSTNITLGMDYRETVFVPDLCESLLRQFLFVIPLIYL